MTPVVDDSEVQYLMDTARFDQAQRVALVMAQSTITPKHLRTDSRTGADLTLPERAANCFRIVNQALRWGLDPFAVMDKTYFVDGRLAYEGQLVAAVVEKHAGLKGKLRAEYDGKGDDRRIVVSGIFKGENEARTIQWTVRQGRTKNAMWNTNPDQKLWYSAVLLWARMHCPGVILGILTDEDLDIIQQNEVKPAGTMTIASELDTVKQEVYAALANYGSADKQEWVKKVREGQQTGKPIEWWNEVLAQIAPPKL